jgi:hypothetical protein
LSDKIKIFSDKKWLPPNGKHVIMLYPFWGDIPLSANDPDEGRFDDYLRVGKNIFEMVSSLENSDVAVLPFEYSFEAEKKELVANASKESKLNGKKLVIFFNSDSIEKISVDNSIVLRTSFFKSKQRLNEFAFPGWSVDFLKKYKAKELVLSKTPKAKVSYCGYIDFMKENRPGLMTNLKSFFSPTKKENEGYGRYLRGKIIRQILSDKKVETDFIIRNGFWAQGIDDKLKAREEYVQNMFNSPYAIVARGAGNFSYRLFEVMSCGRIPVFINTDCVLPFETLINWKKQMVWVEETEVNKISDIVTRFHDAVSETDFVNMQKQNRRIYEEYLSPVGFFKHFKVFLR